MLCLLGALEAVPRHVYEAASLDGAGAGRRFWDQTLPLLRPVLMLVLLMTTMSSLGSFLIILLLTGGGPAAQESTTLSLYAFRAAFERMSVGYGSAVAVLMLALNLVFGATFLLLARRR
jgi:multiple sugar transport system permease protein